MSKYDDIINLPHYVSKKRPQMSIEARSAQFAPFAALTGYDEKVKEIFKELIKSFNILCFKERLLPSFN